MLNDALPTTWKVEPLSSCVQVLDYLRKPVNAKERAKRVGDVPYYGATGQVGWIDDYLFDEELVLLGEDGAPFLDKSRPIAYLITGKSWVNNHAHVLKAIPSLTSNRYVKYYLDWFDFSDYVQGSTRDKLTQTAMNSIPVVLPPISVQSALLDSLDSLQQLHTLGISHLRQAKSAITKFRQAVLVAACSGNLTADWRDRHTDIVSVEHALEQQRGVRRRRAGSLDHPVDIELPELPGTYVLASVGDAANVIEYGTSQRLSASADGVPVLRMGNIQAGRLEMADLKFHALDNEIQKLLLRDGDLLFNRTNSPELVGKSAVYHGSERVSFASYLIRVRFHGEIANPDFVNFWINSTWGRAWAHLAKTDGVSQSNINGSKLALMPIPLPPITEQTEIVRRASAMLQAANEIAYRLDVASRQLERTSQAVLAKAFRGELALRNVEPEAAA